MPTNPLWLEHTERAAWDTVQTLRQQIETERGRVEQLVRLQSAWPKMLELLTSLRQAHDIEPADPVAVVEQMAAELARLKREHAELLERLQAEREQYQRERILGGPAVPQRDFSDASGPFAVFVERIEEFGARGSGKPQRSYERLLDALEARLEELEQAPRRDRYEHAVALAYLAWKVAEGGRRDPDV